MTIREVRRIAEKALIKNGYGAFPVGIVERDEIPMIVVKVLTELPVVHRKVDAILAGEGFELYDEDNMQHWDVDYNYYSSDHYFVYKLLDKDTLEFDEMERGSILY